MRLSTQRQKTARRSSRSGSEYRRGGADGSDYGRRGSGYGDYEREGVRTISGRYSNFEDYSGGSHDRQYRDDSEREFARGGRRGEYSSVNDKDFYEGNTGRSPWRDTYDSERDDFARRPSRGENYRRQSRGYTEFDYDDDRINSRGSRYGGHRGYNEVDDYEREARYGSARDRDERWMNNYDNQDESVDDEYGFRERYNENRY